MKAKYYAEVAGKLLGSGTALAVAGYAACAGIMWCRYGQKKRMLRGEEADSLLDLHIPEYEVVERHQTGVAAPAEITYKAACEIDLFQSAIVRAILKTRELALGCATANWKVCDRQKAAPKPKGLLAEMKAYGWGVLAEIPGREIVLGAVTQPWRAKIVFRALPVEEFAAFREPGYVKIAFTLRADPINASESIARTETRVMTTDPLARTKFRRYWSLVSPGVILIRRTLLRCAKADAERRVHQSKPEYETAEFGRYVEV
jgi:hypothetical protein